MKQLTLGLVATFSLATLLSAMPPQGGQGMGDRKPPQVAIDACEDKEEGTTCQVTTPRGDTLSGTCKNTPDDKYFVCMPDNMGQFKKR